MSIRPSSALLVVLICAAPPLLAQQPSTPPTELRQLSLFVGTWTCSGQMFANDGSPGFATTGTGHGERAVRDHWVEFAFDATGPSGTPPYSVAGFFGYDARKKQFVQTIVDIAGIYQPSFSTGWKDDTLSFEARVEGTTAVRDVFVRKGPRAFSHFTEIQGADGKWVKPEAEECRVTP